MDLKYPISEDDLRKSMVVALSYVQVDASGSNNCVLRSQYLNDIQIDMLVMAYAIGNLLIDRKTNEHGNLSVNDANDQVYDLVYALLKMRIGSGKSISRVLMRVLPFFSLVESVSQRMGVGLVGVSGVSTRIVTDLGLKEGDLVKGVVHRVFEESKSIPTSLKAYRRRISGSLKAVHRFVNVVETQWPLSVVVRLDHVRVLPKISSARDIEIDVDRFVEDLRCIDVSQDLLGFAYNVDFLPEMGNRLHGIYFVRPDCSFLDVRSLIARAWSDSTKFGFTSPYELRHQSELGESGEGVLADVKHDLLQRVVEMASVDEVFYKRDRSSAGFKVCGINASFSKSEKFELFEVKL
ncbi:hypothetical protein [Zoogloea dura]|uniref:Uncharacterized protein n=1 Tax=Zoogloea dura TaxID=2728840 RepID=A0A848G004_9RHOO|nr:hypothetical protein [Zoogloea dura]NML24426.1 hypothetical protein [Zoogloea dura]